MITGNAPQCDGGPRDRCRPAAQRAEAGAPAPSFPEGVEGMKARAIRDERRLRSSPGERRRREPAPGWSAAEAKRMRRQTAKDDRARRGVLIGTPQPGAGRPTKGRRRDLCRRRRSLCRGCLFCCDKRSPGCVGRARRSLVRRSFKYASALAPAPGRLASGLPCLATKPFRGRAPRPGVVALPRRIHDTPSVERLAGECFALVPLPSCLADIRPGMRRIDALGVDRIHEREH